MSNDGIYKIILIMIMAFMVSFAGNTNTKEDEKFSIKKRYRVENTGDVQKICGKVAFDTEGGKYLLEIPTELYKRYRNDIEKTFPDDDGCTFVRMIPIKEYSDKTGVIYTGLVQDTDASDLVEAERREAEKAKREAKKAKREVYAERYYGWYLDIFNKYILPNITKDTSKVIEGLRKLDSGLRPWRLDEHKKTYVIQGLGIVKIAYPKNSDIQNLIDSISKKLNVEKEVKSFDVGKILF